MTTIKGIDEVLAGIKKLDTELQGAAMTKAMHAAAQQAEGYVKANAREEFYTGSRPYTRTGNLINSVQTHAENGKAVVYVGAEYGVYLEMGTSTGIAPRHYLERGVREHVAPIRQAAIQALKRTLGL